MVNGIESRRKIKEGQSGKVHEDIKTFVIQWH